MHLFLNHNDLNALPEGLFDKLGLLKSLALQRNRLTNITTEAFRGLKHLIALDLSANNISHPIRSGTFVHSKGLAYVSLAFNEQVQSIEPGAFGKSLEHIWLTGCSNLTCAALERTDGALPRQASCTDKGSCDGVYGVASIGTGLCDEKFDPVYNTAECLWDGGECD